ncbi:MAG TPA: hypothetical protein VMS45_06500, partial [Gemmatimonadaceae bacterium]|nr:hypothetical protein [Gemmatimonadaceae bacterium]
MRGRASVLFLGLLVAVLLTVYIAYSRSVVRNLRADASRSGQMYARVYRALSDPREESGNAALLDLAQSISALGVPVIVTDTAGRPTAKANLP